MLLLKVLPVVLLVVAASAVMPELDVVLWQQFKQQYGKVYLTLFLAGGGLQQPPPQVFPR